MTAPYFDNLLNAPITPEMLSLFSAPQNATSPAGPMGDAPGPQQQPTPQNATSPAGPMGDVAAPSAPMANVVPAAPQPVAHKQQSLLGRVHDALLSSIIGHPGDAYKGILSPDEIQAATPGLFHAIFTRAPDAAAEARTDLADAAQGKVNSIGFQRQQQIAADRTKYYQGNPLPDAADEASTTQYLRKAYMAAMARGDVDEMSKMNPVLDKLFPKDATGSQTGDPYINPDTKEIRYFPKTPGSSVPAPWQKISGQNKPTSQLFKLGTPDANGASFGYRGSGEIQKGDEPVSVANAEYNQGQVGGRFSKTYVRTSVNDLNNEIDKLGLSNKANLISQEKDLLSMALDSNTDSDTRAALTGPVISNFVQSVEQTKNLRYQLLQYYQHSIDKSFKGTAEMMLERIRNGTLPGNKLLSLQKIVAETERLTRLEIQAQRDNRVKTDPQLDAVLPDVDSYFQSVTPPKKSGADLNDVEGYLTTLRSKKP